MTGIWWGKEAALEVLPPRPASPSSATQPPELTPASRGAVTSELLGRAASYTPEWRRRSASDAGIALACLFGEQVEPVLGRLNRLPDKALVEFLSMAGVEPFPGQAGRGPPGIPGR